MKNKLQFLIVLWVVLLSGAVVFSHYYNMMFAVFVVLLFTYLFKFKLKKNILKKFYAPLLFFLILIILNVIYNQNFSDNVTYLHLFTRIFLASTIPLVLSFNEFRDKYLKIIYFLCWTSITIFLIVVFFRETVFLFPLITSNTGAFFHNLLLAVYNVPLQTFPKNSSIFWEPGAFQAFINIAIAFEVLFYKFQNKKRLIIFVIAILTTFSTTGYIVFILQIISFIFFTKTTNTGVNKIYKILLFSLLGLFLFSGIFISSVIDKFSETNVSYFLRYVGTVLDLSIFTQSPIFGVGPSKYMILIENSAYNEYGINMGVSSNSITKLLAVYGFIFLFLMLYYYFKSTSLLGGKNFLKRLIYFCILIIIFATENFITSFFFLSILFYGFQNKPVSDKINNY